MTSLRNIEVRSLVLMHLQDVAEPKARLVQGLPILETRSQSELSILRDKSRYS
jgi:hypothetical protein